MAEYEILSRGTAFCVASATGESPVFVTCSHVIAPWRYPKYFQEPWLKFVNEKHIRCTVEIPEVGVSS